MIPAPTQAFQDIPISALEAEESLATAREAQRAPQVPLVPAETTASLSVPDSLIEAFNVMTANVAGPTGRAPRAFDCFLSTYGC